MPHRKHFSVKKHWYEVYSPAASGEWWKRGGGPDEGHVQHIARGVAARDGVAKIVHVTQVIVATKRQKLDAKAIIGQD